MCLVTQLGSGIVAEDFPVLGGSCFHGEGQGERACPHAQALVTEPCLITFSFIQQVFIEDLPRAEYSAGPWRHRGELDRRGLPSQELADVSLQRFLAVGS